MSTPHTRHFVLPLFHWQHKKASEANPVALINRKRLMPPKLVHYEGFVGLFGGAADEGETPEQTLRRELAEELPLLDLSALDMSRMSEHDYITITPLNCGEWSQELYQKLAGCCREGEVDVLTLDCWDLSDDNKAPFITPAVREVIVRELKAYGSSKS